MSSIMNWYKKWNRAKNIKKAKSKIPPYLQKSFAEELNYKLWVTKGARFNASDRCKKLNQLSNRTVGYLSAYLIIINMINIYEIPFYIKLPDNYLAFGTTALSILILVFSQFEASRNYQLDAQKHHQCALEISDLYNELREYKTNAAGITSQQLNDIRREYENVLKKYENHEDVDLLRFKISKPNYFELSYSKCLQLKIIYWIKTSIKYHFFIVLPVICIVLFQFLSNK